MRNKLIKILLITFSGVVLLCVFCVMAIDAYINNYSSKYIFSEISDLPDTDTVLILGASVYASGRLSDILSDRAKTAIELYENGKADKILISGYKKDETYDEVSSVRAFLLKNNIAEEDILVDEEGYDTYDSLARAKSVFNINKLIVSTQEYHLPRAIYIGRSLGIDAHGLASDRQPYQRINYFVIREKFANLKAFFEVILN